MSKYKVCSKCGRQVSGNTAVCPWCHKEIPPSSRKTWTDDRPYGLFALVFSLFPVVSFIFGGLALSRNSGKQKTMGKIGLTITFVVHLVLIFVLVLILNIYLEDLKYFALHGN